MNVKKSAKKVFAIAAGLALVGTTVMGALAYDLSNYPAPFVENGMATGAIVVGANAATSDVLGAIDIAASLQAAAVTATPIAGSSTVAVEGGKDYDELDLGTKWPSSDLELKENNLAGFTDTTTISVNGSDVDYFDAFDVAANSTHIMAAQDEDANGQEYVVVDENAVEYRVYFKDSDIETADKDHTAKFKMAGQNVEAYGFDFSTNTFKLATSSDYAMGEGDTQTVSGHTVTLKRVGDGSVIVDVDGQTKIINTGKYDTFEDADDFYVGVDSVFYVEGSDNNVASLSLGVDEVKSISIGEPAELFGQVDDNDEADWVWTMGTDGYRYIGLKSNKAYKDLVIDDAAEQKMPLFKGDAVTLPNDYASLTFESLAATYNDVTISLDDDKYLDDGDTNKGHYSVIEFSAADDIFYIGDDTTDTVYAAYNTSSNQLAKIWYKDGGDETKSTYDTFTIKIDSESVTVTPPINLSASTVTTISAPSDDDLNFSIKYDTTHTDDNFDYFGSADDSDTADLTYGASTLGTKEWDYETNYGIKIANPKNQFDSGKSFKISIPSEQQSVTLVVKSKGSVVSAGSEGGMSYSVNPIALGLGVLDTDAPALGSKPMIIVGGPVANTVAAEFMGNPTADVIAQTFEAGKALIKYDDAKKAMLVAGYDKQETLGASYVVADYKNPKYTFAGNEMSVVVTDLNNIEVTSVN